MTDFAALRAELKPQCEAIIAQYEQSRSALLPLVHLFQSREGYASPDAMRAVSELLDLSQAVVESAVSFYTLFYRKPVGKYMLQVCRGLACTLNGAEDIMAYFREQLGIGHLETADDGLFSYEEVECLAACDRATCMQVTLIFVSV
jgi:NADH-quinone oxidoreductase subunit E